MDGDYDDNSAPKSGLTVKNPNFNPSASRLGGATSGPFAGIGNPNHGKNQKLGGPVKGPLSDMRNPNNPG